MIEFKQTHRWKLDCGFIVGIEEDSSYEARQLHQDPNLSNVDDIHGGENFFM